MKKILLMLAMMLPCLGAWAEVTLPAEGNYYTIQNFRSKKYATYAGDDTQLRQEAVAGLKATWYVTDVVAIDGGIKCKLHNIATDYVYAAYNSFTVSGVTAYIKENPYKSGYVCVSTTENLSSNCWDDQGNKTTIGNYNPRSNDAEGTSWIFEKTVAEVVISTCSYEIKNSLNETFTGEYNCVTYNGEKTLPKNIVNSGAELQDVVWNENTLKATIIYPFPISNAETTNKMLIDGYAYNSLNMKIYAKEDTSIKVDKGLNPTADNIENSLWAIYPNIEDGTYSIKNIATGKYIHTTATSGSHNADVLSFNETATPFTLVKDSWGYSFKVADKNLYLSINSSGTETEQPVGLHGNTHAGSSWKFTPYVVKYTLTDEAGNEFTGEFEGWSELQPAFPALSGVHNYSISNQVWGDGTLTGTIAFTVPVSSNTKANIVMIASFNENQKWCAVGNDVKVKKAVPTSSDIATWLWEIYPVCESGTIAFKIKNVATQLWVTVNKNTNSFDTQGTVTLTNEPTLLEQTTWLEKPCFKVLDQTVYLTINSTNDTDVYLATWLGGNANHHGNKIHFPQATYTLKVGKTGYATLYSPISGTFAGEVKTFAIESASNNSALLSEKIGVAANQGAIVMAEEGTYTFTVGSVDSNWSNNLLKGSIINTCVKEDAYVLALVDEKAALALATKNKNAVGDEGTTHFLNNAGKAYLPASAVVSGARSLFFNNGTTGIEETIVAPVFNANAPIYDLSGRRVNNAVKGGIYIQNGKKFIVK